MALDSDFINITDDSLINIAVKWYNRHGNPDEKLKAYRYFTNHYNINWNTSEYPLKK